MSDTEQPGGFPGDDEGANGAPSTSDELEGGTPEAPAWPDVQVAPTAATTPAWPSPEDPTQVAPATAAPASPLEAAAESVAPGTTAPAADSPDASAGSWAAATGPTAAKSGPSLVRRLAIPLVVLVVVIGGVVFRDRLGGNSSDLVAGDCFDAPSAANAPAAGVEIGDVQHHPCSEAHKYEVFVVLQHPADKNAPYPGADALFSYAETNCLPPFAAYIGVAYGQSTLQAGSIVPQEDGWKSGERKITCYVGNSDDSTLTGSLKGAAR